MYRFIDKYEYGEPYVFVHPYKQEAVRYLVKNKPDWVQYIIIFGSALHICHFYEKDLDVCLIGKDSQTLEEENYSHLKAMKLKGTKYDFLHYKSLEELKDLAYQSFQNVEKSIFEEGVVVYEK